MSADRSLEAASAAVLAGLDESQAFIVDLAQKLVGFRSVNPRYTAEGEPSEEPEIQEFLDGLMRELGLETDSWEVFPSRPNVVGRLRGSGNGRDLAFNGHVDVVPLGDESRWTRDPWGSEIDGGRLYGRGSYDMKGGIAAFIGAIKAIREAGIELGGCVELHSVVDEEGGGAGTRSVVERGDVPEAVIVAEPTDGDVLPVEGGLTWLRVTIAGRSAHAGWRYAQIYPQDDDGAPESHGVNAIEKATKFLAAVRELEREWALSKRHPLLPAGITTINPGVISAGVGLGADGLPIVRTNPAMVPDVCVIDFDFKYLPSESFDAVSQEFQSFVEAFSRTDAWLAENPPLLEWHLSSIDFPPVDTPVDHPLVEALVETRGGLGLETEVRGFAAVTDGAFYAGAGVAPVICGPSGAGLHGEDEYVEVESLIETARVYAGVVLRWCGVA